MSQELIEEAVQCLNICSEELVTDPELALVSLDRALDYVLTIRQELDPLVELE